MTGGAALMLLGFGLSQLHIPLSKAEADALFEACSECKSPPTYRNIDPNATIPIFASGIPILLSGIIMKAFNKKSYEQETKQ